MASEGAASRLPPLASSRKRQASEDQKPYVFITFKRRRRGNKSNSNSGSDPNTTAQMSMVVARGGNPQQAGPQERARHWRSWRDTLEGFLQSPSMNQGPGGIQSCIRDALRSNGCQPLQQVTRSVSQGNLANGHGEARESPSELVNGRRNNGSLVPVEDGTISFLEANKAMCNTALFDILASEKFALLCHSLTATFHINKPDEVIGLANIDARMRNGDYAQDPKLFDHDIKQIWEKFEQIGRDMAGLANSLSVISRASYLKQTSGHSEIDITEHKTEETSLVGLAHKATPTQLTPCDSGHSTIPKRTGTPRLDGVGSCTDCGKKANSQGIIICDGCEVTYHVSCLNLDLEDVPVKWYCPACIESAKFAIKNNKNVPTHKDCNVCDWLDIIKPKEVPDAVVSLEEDSEQGLCKYCGTCEDEDKKFLVCGHPYCSYKFYHIRCLKESRTAKKRQKNRGCWYCPSCLCRGCFKDKDDEYIVLCDGCDDAYHIYCMKPPHISIPKGKWYCTSCSMLRATGGLQKYEKSIMQGVKSILDSKKARDVVS